MGKSVNLEALKSHLFETLEGIKNQNDPEASENEKLSIEQAKAIVEVADSIIDIYKVQVEALKAVSHMDNIAPANAHVLNDLGVVGDEEIKMIS